jgi:hypothetical protein
MLKLSSIAGASVIGGGITGYAIATPAMAADGTWPAPLTKKINIKQAAKTAYANYYVRGCMYGTFTGVVKAVADNLGAPYSQFPFEMMHYGAGGGELWGSLCGTLNGGLAALAFFVSDTTLRRQMASQMMNWYESVKQPVWQPKKPLRDVPNKLPKSKSESTMCHTSISRWVARSGFDAFGPERADRCGRLAASVAWFVANLLNEAVVKGKLKSRKEMSKDANACLACHGKGDAGLNEPNILSKMDCTPCHDAETDKTVFPHQK